MPFHHHLKHWLVPHKRNDHRPHLIRAHGLVVMAVLIIGVQAAAMAFQPAATRVLVQGQVLGYGTNITPLDLLTFTNQERAAAGLPALRLDSRLNQAATLKASNMFSENYWAHVSPSGLQPWHWFTQAAYPYQYAGENLAKDFDTSSGVMQGWMNSPGHKANVLGANYTDVGFAVQNGSLVGGETTLVVAHYGSTTSKGATVAATVPAATPKPTVKAATSTPAPTPVPTPESTPQPTATPVPSPSASPSAAPVVAQASPNAPPPASYSLFRPLSFIRTLNWNTLITITLLGLLLVIYLATHITVWRKGLRRWRSHHYRFYAAAQVSSLAVAIVLLAVSGFGKVG